MLDVGHLLVFPEETAVFRRTRVSSGPLDHGVIVGQGNGTVKLMLTVCLRYPGGRLDMDLKEFSDADDKKGTVEGLPRRTLGTLAVAYP
jgi:hypothetical protein